MRLHDLCNHPERPPIDLRDVAEFLLFFERNIMAQLDDLKSQVQGMKDDLAAVNDKLNTEIGKTDTLITALADAETALAYANQSSNVDLSGIIDDIKAARASVKTVSDAVDAESVKLDGASIAAPAPAPAPATTVTDGTGTSETPPDTTSTDGGTPAP